MTKCQYNSLCVGQELGQNQMRKIPSEQLIIPYEQVMITTALETWTLHQGLWHVACSNIYTGFA